MLFRRHSHDHIPHDDWEMLQIAHNEASNILGRDPRTHSDADRLAREIICLYESGGRGPIAMALKAVETEIVIGHRNRRATAKSIS
jgi:hypothetical protein